MACNFPVTFSLPDWNAPLLGETGEVAEVIATPEPEAPVPTPETVVVTEEVVVTQEVLVEIPACIYKAGDKTFAEPTSGDWMWRIEVGGHLQQAMDFYPRGYAAVSYLLPPIPDPDGVPAIWYGYGSLWEETGQCSDFDLAADADHYARARLDSGHSGLVVDLRKLDFSEVMAPSTEMLVDLVVTNTTNMDDESIQNLLSVHAQYMRDLYGLGLVGEDGVLTEEGAEALAQPCTPDRDRDFGFEEEVGPYDFWVNLQPWFGDPKKGPDGNGEINYLLVPGVSLRWFEASDIKGGAVWTYEHCTYEQVVADLEWSGLPVYHQGKEGGWVEGPLPKPTPEP
jgi:hypothetical protein